MTLALSPRRLREKAAPAAVDLADEGIHRDPGNHDPIATGGFAQRLVHKVSGALSGGTTSRRSFLTRTAVVGSALAVGPIDFILKPGSAYGYVCGTCSEGWTAFCCTINSGRNSCPPGSFIAGWWKADNAAYCCGAARYIIDCNATCPTQCSCRCAGGSCDNRKTCCNQFRYGQCHQEISCYGPVVCRVATCTVPWQYDPSCTTASATDNRTREHGAPCLTTDCGPSAIAKKYAELGGAGGRLGPIVTAEAAVGDGRGRRARYQNGNIYWTQATGAHETRGAVVGQYDVQGGPTGALGYPITDTLSSGENRSRYCTFENGRIYVMVSNGAAYTVRRPFFQKHQQVGGIAGNLGYPTSNLRATPDGQALVQDFERGHLYQKGSNLFEVRGAVATWHDTVAGGPTGPYGYPGTDLLDTGDGRGKSQWFTGGLVWNTASTGCHGLRGGTLSRYITNGSTKSSLKYPTSDTTAVPGGRGTYATFEGGNIYALGTAQGFQVGGAVLAYYLAQGGPTGSLGFPTSELTPPGGPAGRRRYQSFENGRIEYLANGTVIPA